MRTITQHEAIKSIRKPCPPPTRIERPFRGGGYRRRNKWSKNED
jgi:hypothetical protein